MTVPDVRNDITEAYSGLVLKYREVHPDSGQQFFVDGDSLIIDLLSSPIVDLSYGGQGAQLIHALETIIQRMLGRSRRFYVVFFDCLSGIWLDPALQTLRHQVILHLQTSLDIKVREIAHIFTRPFARCFFVAGPHVHELVGPGRRFFPSVFLLRAAWLYNSRIRKLLAPAPPVLARRF